MDWINGPKDLSATFWSLLPKSQPLTCLYKLLSNGQYSIQYGSINVYRVYSSLCYNSSSLLLAIFKNTPWLLGNLCVLHAQHNPRLLSPWSETKPGIYYRWSVGIKQNISSFIPLTTVWSDSSNMRPVYDIFEALTILSTSKLAGNIPW